MTVLTDTINRAADTDSALLPSLAQRWSPRGFDPEAVIDEAVLTAILEAARWSPSASNMQPARFIVGRRGSATFTTIHSALMGFNSAWADAASVLVVGVAELARPTGEGENPWARYDLGQAVAHLSIQAQHEGVHTHQMGGFENAPLVDAFSLTATQAVVTVTALGVLADVSTLSPEFLERESAPRTRMPLTQILLAND